MRRSLLSSLVALILMGASCGQNDQSVKEDPSQGSKEPEAKTMVEENTTSNPSEGAVNTLEEAPTHLTPNPSKLDSVKNSYPKKK